MSWVALKNKIYILKKWAGGGEMGSDISGYKVSVMQNEQVLEAAAQHCAYR